MLVLSRKSQQQIHIGDDVVITIVRVRGNSVRVGIEAPKSVSVRRGELAPKNEVNELETFTVEQADRPVETRVIAGRAATDEEGRMIAPLGKYLRQGNSTSRNTNRKNSDATHVVSDLLEFEITRPLAVAEAAL